MRYRNRTGISHCGLIQILDQLCGYKVGGTILQWFSSFLKGIVPSKGSWGKDLPIEIDFASRPPPLFNIYMKLLVEIMWSTIINMLMISC